MASDDEDLERIRANADIVVEKFKKKTGDAAFGFNAKSVEWLNGFIEQLRAGGDHSPEFVISMVSILGSFLGECMVRVYGGRWVLGENGWGVELNERVTAFPFAKIQKQFENGNEGGDNIHSFFTLIPLILSQKESRNDRPPTPDF